MKQYLYRQLEMGALESILNVIRDYYRDELFQIKRMYPISNECHQQLNQQK